MIAVDVGNTKTAFAFFRHDSLIRQWQIGTDSKKSADEYRQLLNEFLSTIGESLKTAEQIMLASVVPAVTEEFLPLRKEIDIHVVSHKSPVSFTIAIPEPAVLGADRIANLEGAIRKYGAPVIVVDVGTAISVNAINGKRQFIGGAIAPGVGISMDALFTSAALLTRAPLSRPERAIGRNTIEAIESGVHFGFAALVDGLITKVREELGEEEVRIVGKGGATDMLAPYINPSLQFFPTLTLEGLRFIHDNLKSGKRAYA